MAVAISCHPTPNDSTLLATSAPPASASWTRSWSLAGCPVSTHAASPTQPATMNSKAIGGGARSGFARELKLAAFMTCADESGVPLSAQSPVLRVEHRHDLLVLLELLAAEQMQSLEHGRVAELEEVARRLRLVLHGAP